MNTDAPVLWDTLKTWASHITSTGQSRGQHILKCQVYKMTPIQQYSQHKWGWVGQSPVVWNISPPALKAFPCSHVQLSSGADTYVWEHSEVRGQIWTVLRTIDWNHLNQLKKILSVTLSTVVSASEVTPTDRWLNVWCIWHTKVETLQEFRSCHRIGWIIRQTPSRKKKAVVFTTVTTSTYQDQLNAGFSKVCEQFKFRGTESLKYVREFYIPVYYCGDISMPRNVTLNETNCDWMFDMSVKWPHGRALAN